MANLWNKCKTQIGTVPVRGGLVDILYVGYPDQHKDALSAIGRWKKSIVKSSDPSSKDSIELARLGLRRWNETHFQGQTADSIDCLKAMIQNNPHCEVRVLAIARAHFRKYDKIVGICSFRRTWCNNIALEIVAAHPGLDVKQRSAISGLGTGLVHHVCAVADAIQAQAIWGECTQNSQKFYTAFYKQPSYRKDLIVLRRAEYKLLKSKIETLWQSAPS